jgi:hypothetical protein
MSSFTRLATETASTKRPPTISGGRRGAAVTHVTTLTCTPLDPVSAEIAQRVVLDTPHELLQTFVSGTYDIAEGDTLVYASQDYPIRACSEWKWGSGTYLHLILEDLNT